MQATVGASLIDGGGAWTVLDGGHRLKLCSRAVPDASTSSLTSEVKGDVAAWPAGEDTSHAAPQALRTRCPSCSALPLAPLERRLGAVCAPLGLRSGAARAPWCPVARSLLGRRSSAGPARLWPNLLATVSYIFGNWVAQVTPFAPAGYALIVVTCCAYLSTAYDQVRIVMATDRGVSGFKFKAGSIMMKEVVFVVYAAMNLMGIFGLVSSETEQFFFSLGDVLLKVVQGSILVIVRNWESLSELSDGLQRRVEAGAKGHEMRRPSLLCMPRRHLGVTKRVCLENWPERGLALSPELAAPCPAGLHLKMPLFQHIGGTDRHGART